MLNNYMKFRMFLELNSLKHGLKQVADVLVSLVNPIDRKMMDAVPKAHDAANKYWRDPRFLAWLSQNGIEVPDGLPE